jgi:hypothetical protein
MCFLAKDLIWNEFLFHVFILLMPHLYWSLMCCFWNFHLFLFHIKQKNTKETTQMRKKKKILIINVIIFLIVIHARDIKENNKKKISTNQNRIGCGFFFLLRDFCFSSFDFFCYWKRQCQCCNTWFFFSLDLLMDILSGFIGPRRSFHYFAENDQFFYYFKTLLVVDTCWFLKKIEEHF